MTADAPRRRFLTFQFNLGSMMWLTLVVAMGLAWWNDRKQFDARLAKLEGPYTPQRLWSAADAIGAPDDLTGMSGKSWCQANAGGKDWIELEYNRAMIPATIDIYETYAVGCVTEVVIIDRLGKETVIWSGTDPTPAGGRTGVFKVPVTTKGAVQSVRISIDSSKVSSWACIDAVGLTTANGRTEWASAVDTSSCYGGSPTKASNSSWTLW